MLGVEELFRGKHVFITGGSGFMGKVFLEKILRSCPGVECVYVLLRPKKGKSIADRLHDITNTPLFDLLRKESPGAVSKLRAVAGDCSELRLGLSAEDEALLVEQVSFVFHAAASVRFDDPLKSAVLLNTRGTREVVELAKKMKKLEVLQYVSTTYCFTNQPVVEEKSYDAHLDWRVVLELAEREDARTFDAFSHKLLDFQPNTYTFSKSLAENIIRDAHNDIPVMIFRPAVVISSVKEPMPGWLDNLYGPFGVWAAVTKGVLRFSYGDPNVALAFTPVDWAIRGMLLSAWARANGVRVSDQDSMVDVVNMEGSKHDRSTYGEQRDVLPTVLQYTSRPIRYPRYYIGKCYVYFWLGTMLSHIPYGLLIDSLLLLSGKKPRLLSIYRKIFQANGALSYFMHNEFPIRTNNIEGLEKLIPERDREQFSCAVGPGTYFTYDRETYHKNIAIGVTKYVFKDELPVEENEKHLRKLLILEALQYILFACLLYWTVGKGLLHRFLPYIS